MLPFVGCDRRLRLHADAVAGPNAIEASFEDAVLQHQVEAVVADVGAERVLEYDHGLRARGGVANPKVEAESVPAVDVEQVGKVGAVIAVEADGLAVDAGDAL